MRSGEEGGVVILGQERARVHKLDCYRNRLCNNVRDLMEFKHVWFRISIKKN